MLAGGAGRCSRLRKAALLLLAVPQARALFPHRYRDALGHPDERVPRAESTSDSAENGSPSGIRAGRSSKPDGGGDVQELYLTQRLDHFDPLNGKTYSQRYFFSDRYVRKQDSSVDGEGPAVSFLCVGGEGPGFTTSVLVDSVHCTGDMIELARRLFEDHGVSVFMYALEHRYYGDSYPDFGPNESPVSTHNLKYLSSRQALEDLSHFVHTMKGQQRESQAMLGSDSTADPRHPWVTFGGSYPGILAANARLKYPHLIFAAVSNSAPLDAKVDFPGYQRRLGWDLRYEKIGGSQKCYEIVKQGHEQAVAMLEEDPARLGRLFDVCDPETTLLEKENQDLLVGDGLIQIYAQGNDPSCEYNDICNIEKLCDYMLDSFEGRDGESDQPKTELDVLVDVAAKQRGELGGEGCQSVDFQEMLRELAKPEVEDFGTRSWLWQTCTEFGFYQTCDDTCPFASYYHTVDQDLTVCEVAYNITNVYENVQATRDHYGGLDIAAGSRVLSVNGDVDPWSVLGLKMSPKHSLPVEMVPGASHHFWTHMVKDTDAPEIVNIRAYIYSVVMDWLGIESREASAPKSSTTSSFHWVTLE